MASEILTGGIFMVFAPYNDVCVRFLLTRVPCVLILRPSSWRKMRRAASENFTPRASEQYQPMQTLQAGLTILDILANPDAWEDALYR